MTTKTWLIVGIIIVSLVIFVFGKEAISYLSGSREYTREAVKDRIPPEFEISRLKSMLGKLDGGIEKRREALVEMQLQGESLEKEIGQRRKRLDEDDAILRKVAGMLEKKQDTYEIGGIAYSYAEVDTDAVIKAERFRQDKELLAAREKTLVQFTVAISDNRKILSDAEVERQRLANAVEQLEIRTTQLKTMNQIETGKERGKDQSLGKAYVSIQKAITELEHRLEKGERLFDIKKTGVQGIDYAKNTVRKSGMEAITEVLR